MVGSDSGGARDDTRKGSDDAARFDPDALFGPDADRVSGELREESRRSESRRRQRKAERVVGDRREFGLAVRPALRVLVVVSAVAGAASGVQPTGTWLPDVLWGAAFAAVVTMAASRARRGPLVWLATLAAAMSVTGSVAVAATGLLGLAGAVASTVPSRRGRLLGTVTALFAVQALLRAPSFGPFAVPTLLAAIATVPVLWSGWRMCRSNERVLVKRLAAVVAAVVTVGVIGALVSAGLASTGFVDGSRSAEAGLDSVRNGDTVEATEQFATARTEFTSARQPFIRITGWFGRWVPIVGQHMIVLDEVGAAGVELARTAEITSGTADWRTLTAENGRVDLARVEALAPPVAEASAAIDGALATVAAVQSPWLLAPLDAQLGRLSTRLGSTASQASIAADALAVAPALLGAEGPRNYLVALATPGETRDGGGFVGSYAVVEAVDGELSMTRNSPVRELNSVTDEPPLVLPPDWSIRYSGYDLSENAGNLSASPSWPESADVARQLLARSAIAPQVPGGASGVIYADPIALAALLTITGPVTVPGIGFPLTSDNAVQYLLVDQYVQYADDNARREALLGEVSQAVFDALVGRPVPGVEQLTEALGPAVAGGHLRLTTFDRPAETELLDRTGISGRWIVPPGDDWLSVRSTDLLFNKIDVYQQRRITVDTVIDPVTGRLTSTVTVAVTNDAPPSGLPRYLIGNNLGLPDGTNRNLLTVFTPHDLTAATVDGAPVGVRTLRQFGGRTYGVVLELPPRSTATVVFTLEGLVTLGPDYRLEVLGQALARPDSLTLTVRSAEQPGSIGRIVESPALPARLPLTAYIRKGS